MLSGFARERDTPSARLDAAEIDQLARNDLGAGSCRSRRAGRWTLLRVSCLSG
jgi:hypothetical protein